jgi:hypothetical protein
LGEANMFPAGVRSPPLRGVDHPRARRPCGASPGITREVVFSEGRTPCVLLAWPNVCRGISFPPAFAGEKPGHPRGYVSVKPGPSLRACGARPFAGGPSEGEKALRGQTRRWRERRFSRRDALCASALQGRTRAEAFHFHPMMRPEASALPGTCLGQASAFLSGRAEPAPPRGGPSEGKAALRGKPGDNARGGFLGGARSPRPGGKARRMSRHTGSRPNLPLPVCEAPLSRVTRRTKRALGVGLSKVAKGPPSKATTTGGRR